MLVCFSIAKVDAEAEECDVVSDCRDEEAAAVLMSSCSVEMALVDGSLAFASSAIRISLSRLTCADSTSSLDSELSPLLLRIASSNVANEALIPSIAIVMTIYNVVFYRIIETSCFSFCIWQEIENESS